MNNVPCRNRTFLLELRSVYDYVLSEYSHWLMCMTHRLGRESALEVWNDALLRFDVEFLDQILSNGWSEAPSSCNIADSERPMEGILEVFFADHDSNDEEDEDREIIMAAPPLLQIREKLAQGPIHRSSTTYEAIHLYCHGFALMAESLIDRFGCLGMLLAYDIRLEEIAMTNFEKLSVEEFIKRRRTRFSKDPEELEIHSAGLEAELISSSDTEIVTHTTECEWVRYYRDHHPTVGYLMCCSVDDIAYRAINERLRLQRTTTLMEGSSCCDFRIFAVE
ncbi:MAG: L-2-amino-thiazoline-4-carboxylic acid hydrolase [candidate division Zixibacteria bacterium]|nr:L-2-amino-thiazoline-4-carboxylic acid hydrolase [candidate division Zixibacteria bacterium]